MLNDPVATFHAERAERLHAWAQDAEFQALSQTWLRESMRRRYVYHFDWMGRPIIQYPQDMVALQELVWAARPDLIVETGIAHGGSLVYSASLLALLDLDEAIAQRRTIDPAASRRRVVGVDIDIRPHNRAALDAHPMRSRIELVEGSSIAAPTVERVHALARGHERVLVLLDSMHTHEHVLAELDAYAPLVSPGSWCVVFDTFVEDLPRGFFADRPWDPGNSPKSAVRQWLPAHPEFAVDAAIATKLMVTVAPDGFLKRLR